MTAGESLPARILAALILFTPAAYPGDAGVRVPVTDGHDLQFIRLTVAGESFHSRVPSIAHLYRPSAWKIPLPCPGIQQRRRVEREGCGAPYHHPSARLGNLVVTDPRSDAVPTINQKKKPRCGRTPHRYSNKSRDPFASRAVCP